MEINTLHRSGSSPYLLGTGSTGMLLVTSNPLGDQFDTSYRSMDRSFDRQRDTPHSNGLRGLESSRSPMRSSEGHYRDSDSGISNGTNSLSPRSRYRSGNSLDRQLDGSITDHTNGYHSYDTANDTSSSSLHRKSKLSASHDLSSSGRSLSMTRLNMNTSQDWGSSTGRIPTHSQTRTGASTQDLNRSSLRVWNGDRDDLQQALEESEDRRQLLVERLKDAQDTIKMQSKRLIEIEESSKDTMFTVEDLKLKEKDYRKKLANMDREKSSYHDKHMEQLKFREELQYRIENLTTELASLRTTTEIMQADMKRKDNNLAKMTSSVAELEEDNNKLLKCKETMSKEINALRQSLELSKSRSDYLEDHSKDTKGEIYRLKEENSQLIQEKRSLGQKMSSIDSRNYSLTEESKALAYSVQSLTEEKNQLHRQLSSLDSTLADLKSTLASTSSDKERFFQQKMDLTNQIQMVSYEKENLDKVRCGLEEQICELNAELAHVKLQNDKGGEHKRKQEEEMTAVKKVGEVLSLELSGAKARLEKVLDQNQSLEQTKMLAFQQHDLYEQEIQSLETQLKHAKNALTNMREDQQKDKESSDQATVRLKEELRDVKNERNQIELKCHEVEAKLRQSELNLKDHSEELNKQIETWKDQCEKVTASNSRKELEIQTMSKKLSDLEEECAFIKDSQEMYQAQYEELAGAQEEANKAKEENRRLLQERAENQQVIQLLEMQKNILAKTSEGSLSKIHDAQQLQYQVEQLSSDKQLMQERIDDYELKEKRVQEKLAAKKQGLEDRSVDIAATNKERLRELETQNHQLKSLNSKVTIQMTKVEQENVGLQTKYRDCVSKTDYKSLERENAVLEESLSHLKTQYSKLEGQYEQVISSEKSRANDAQDLWVVQKEKESLEHQVSLLNSQINILEDHKSQAENKNTQLQKQLDAVHEKLFNFCQEDNSQVVQQQKQVNQLTSELEESKQVQTSQQLLINSLKEQSLDAVQEDLTSLRTQLQSLGEVIQGKDVEIEQLEKQLGTTKKQLSDREKKIEILTTGSGSGKDEGDYGERNNNNNSLKEMKRYLEQRVEELEEEKEEIADKSNKMKKERDLAVQDSEDLREALDDLQKLTDDERSKMMEKMKKDLAAKDRQIESLEEQLRRTTNTEIKKLKRGASKVELLKAENRRLQAQITSPTDHLPRFPTPEDSDPLLSTDEPSAIGARLGERFLHRGSSPSERLLSRLYGEDASKEAQDVVDAAEADTNDKSNSWEDSSEEDRQSVMKSTDTTSNGRSYSNGHNKHASSADQGQNGTGIVKNRRSLWEKDSRNSRSDLNGKANKPELCSNSLKISEGVPSYHRKSSFGSSKGYSPHDNSS